MADTTLPKKLLIKPGYRVLLLNAPAGYRDILGALEGVEVSGAAEGAFDLVQVFARMQADVERLAPGALAATKPGGILWWTYPKKTGKITSDLTRDHGWQALAERNYQPVTQIAIDETWSALRFRPTAEVGR
ncbi:MAG TPA: hypothetical protein VH590_21355 [Ktedonobacterales bacterium]|jgi:hypothetical protein